MADESADFGGLDETGQQPGLSTPAEPAEPFEGADAIKDAARELSKRRREAEQQPSLEQPSHDPPPSEVQEIGYTDPATAPENLTLRTAAKDLAAYRAAVAEQERAALEKLGVELPAEQPAERPTEAQESFEQQAEQIRVAEEEAAAERYAAEQAYAQQQIQVRGYAEGVANGLAALSGIAIAEFPDIRTPQDVQRLAQTDPARFARFQQLDQAARNGQAQLHHSLQHLSAAAEAASAHADRLFQTWAEEQEKQVVAAIPELAGPDKGRFQKAAADTLLQGGFSEQELRAAWNGKGTVSLRDARVQAVIADAVRYREAMAGIAKPTPKPLPPVQRPGVSRDSVPTVDADLDALNRRLSKTGKIDDAYKLLVAKRAARG